jgi:hypothetical protein
MEKTTSFETPSHYFFTPLAQCKLMKTKIGFFSVIFPVFSLLPAKVFVILTSRSKNNLVFPAPHYLTKAHFSNRKAFSERRRRKRERE